MTKIKSVFAAAILMILWAAPAHSSCWQWSKTASANATADPSINWSEGMAPSAVNDSARAMMARLAECRDDLSGFNVTSGGPVAFSLTSNQGTIAAIPNDGQAIKTRLNVTNGSASTLVVDGGTAYPIQSAPGVAVASGVLVAGTPYELTFNLSSLAWVLNDFYATTIAPGSVVTSMLADNAVAYRKMQKPSTTSRLLGTPSLAVKTITGAANNGSGLIRLTMADTTGLTTGVVKTVSGVVGTTEANNTWTLTVINGTTVDLQGSAFVNTYISGGQIGGAVEEISLGTGLSMNGNVLVSAPAPSGSFKSLSIKVATNTTVNVAADYVTTINGSGGFQTTAVNCTGGSILNMATTGINGLDTGSIASATWYYVWVMVKDDGTTGCTASVQSTANATFLSNRPSGYTYYARIGALRTASGGAQLRGTWQLGRRAQYIVGLAQTFAASPIMASGLAGNLNAPTWQAVSVSNFVPPTASEIIGTLHGFNSGAMLAPNDQYQGMNSTVSGPVASLSSSISWAIPFQLMLESSNLYWASDTVNGQLVVSGWVDNL